MKIDKVRLVHISMPLQTMFETSFGAINQRECILIQVFSEGITGWGECVADRDPGYSYETASTAWIILRDFLVPAVLGCEFVNVRNLPAHIAFIRGNPMAKAGLELSFWDLAGKMEKSSLQRMLGKNVRHTKERVDVGVSVGLQPTPQDLVKSVEGYLQQGYKRIKIKIKPGRDVEDTRILRETFPQVLLQVDANSAYSLSDVEILAKLDEFSLLLIEQPLADDDLWDHSKLQQQIKTAICLDESIHSLRHTRQATEMDSCRVINIKAGRVGGLTEAVKIHDYCLEHHLPVWCGGMLETGIGRAANLALASLPGFTLPGDISATERYYLEDITHQQFCLNTDSTIDVPLGVGLGVDVDETRINKFKIREIEIK